MKLKIVMMLVILGVMAVTPMIYTGKFDPLSRLSALFDSGGATLSKIQADVPAKLSSVVSDERVEVYKWRDKNGVMQFSNTPPPAATAAESVILNPDRNVIDAVKIPPAKAVSKPAAAPASVPVPSPYSVKSMKKVMDDARNVEQMLQRSFEERQKTIDQL